jgi:putative ABC transport system ATP-binding protein
VIRIEELTKVYQIDSIKVEALRGINLTVAPGEFLAIIGPSGTGKSTLMNIIGCLDVPTSGRYWLNKREVGRLTDNQLAEVRNREIGFVFQSFNLLPRLSALENVERPLVYRGVDRKERVIRAKEALARVGLGDRMLHRPAQLSGGQQQRVAIARALVGDPSLILADEPTGNLDSTSGSDILNMIKELHTQGKTIVLITHDLDVARQAQRVVRIHDGRIVGEERGAC